MKNFMRYNFNIDKIVLSCFVPKNTGNNIHRNRASHGLAFHISGMRTYFFKTGEIIKVEANDIIYMPKHSDYDVMSESPGECYAINFDIPETVAFKPFVIKVKNSNYFLDCFKNTEKVWKSKEPGYEIKCKANLYNILYKLQQQYFSYISSKKEKIIQPAVDYIHSKYTETPLRISELSAMCNITPEYFRFIFKNIYGMSPNAYINKLKISRAKELLSSKLYSVTEVCFMSGFNDVSHFSREFKKDTEISPSEFKRLL